jgi:hypothetical protein
MNTSPSSPTLESALSAVGTPFRSKLVKSYRDLKAAFVEGKHDACGLRVGRFAEILLRYLQQTLTGTFVAFGQQVKNFGQECHKLENLPQTSGVESFRVLIPRALNFVYSLRNKRGIGHVGGDIDANAIDAATCVRIADWCLAELMRVVHTLSLEEAQALLDAISLKQMPYVWNVMGKNRILSKGLDYSSQTLLLLYSSSDSSVPVEDLFAWVEHPRLATFRFDILSKLHANRFIEYDKDTQMIVISPKGIARVEKDILPSIEESSV